MYNYICMYTLKRKTVNECCMRAMNERRGRGWLRRGRKEKSSRKHENGEVGEIKLLLYYI